MKTTTHTRIGLFLVFGLLIGCDGAGEPEPSTSLSGVVRASETNMPVSGVEVSTGAFQATTGADGRFEFLDVPEGPRTIVATADGYDAYSSVITIQEGDNTHDILLDLESLYTFATDEVDFALYLKPETQTFRGVLFLVAGSSNQSLDFVYGEDLWATNLSFVDTREEFLDLADRYSLAVMGADTHDNTSLNARRDVFLALEAFADGTGHAELAEAPILLDGYSLGGCFAYDITSDTPERIVGFITQKGGCHAELDRGPAKFVPGYLFIGENDLASRFDNITAAFEVNRLGGALWSVAEQPAVGHDFVELTGSGRNLTTRWMEAVLDLRLPPLPPPGDPVVLNLIDEASGWLGNRETFEIAAYECYTEDKLQASWLPTMATAQQWQAFVSGGSVTTIVACI